MELSKVAQPTQVQLYPWNIFLVYSLGFAARALGSTLGTPCRREPLVRVARGLEGNAAGRNGEVGHIFVTYKKSAVVSPKKIVAELIA